MAAGFTAFEKHEAELRRLLSEDVRQLVRRDPDILKTPVKADLTVAPADLSLDLAKQIAQMEPFGQGNVKPLFEIRLEPGTGPRITDVRRMGKNQEHLKFSIADGAGSIECVRFYAGELPEDVKSIIASLEINEWKGRQSLQLIVNSLTRR
jgi:single-stranded-DNA-specific exonuclease